MDQLSSYILYKLREMHASLLLSTDKRRALNFISGRENDTFLPKYTSNYSNGTFMNDKKSTTSPKSIYFKQPNRSCPKK